MELQGSSRNPKRIKKELVIAEDDAAPVEYREKTKLFEGPEFYVLSEGIKTVQEDQDSARNNDQLKVKPEYISEFSELLDYVIIGSYYGHGKRGISAVAVVVISVVLVLVLVRGSALDLGEASVLASVAGSSSAAGDGMRPS
ncbi:DNA ligase 4 [Cladobotryum mycophilum]|uniref:DNA ligase 4 n=1 Tax=Cladobotryum mycophilum TaxID=491253 RepID=A0ABR0SLX2_9HYPO